jgi:hypothetical protein
MQSEHSLSAARFLYLSSLKSQINTYASHDNQTLITMYPVICKVDDFDEVGIQGMHVALTCYSDSTGPSERFESCTNSQGIIEKWFSCAASSSEMKYVDARKYGDISLTFSTSLYFGNVGTPWVAVHAQLKPDMPQTHAVKLQFGPGNESFCLKRIPMKLRLHSGVDLGKQASTLKLEGTRQDSVPTPLLSNAEPGVSSQVDTRILISSVPEEESSSSITSGSPPDSN